MTVIDALHEETKSKQDGGSFINELVQGYVSREYECTKCSEKSTRKEEFKCLMLDIPTKKGTVTLEDCIKETMKIHYLLEWS